MTAVQDHFDRRVVYCPGCLLLVWQRNPDSHQPSQSNQGLTINPQEIL
jgi:hypothetical protein